MDRGGYGEGLGSLRGVAGDVRRGAERRGLGASSLWRWLGDFSTMMVIYTLRTVDEGKKIRFADAVDACVHSL